MSLNLNTNFGEFCRRMRIKWRFHNEPTLDFSEMPAFDIKSPWNPPNGDPPRGFSQ